MPAAYPVYVVDDQEVVRDVLCALCSERGLVARGFAGGGCFLDALSGLAPGCVLLDMRMPVRSGLDVQAEMAARAAPMTVVAISGHGFVDMAVESMKLGAVDFIEKPIDNDALFDAIERAFRVLDERLAGAGSALAVNPET